MSARGRLIGGNLSSGRFPKTVFAKVVPRACLMPEHEKRGTKLQKYTVRKLIDYLLVKKCAPTLIKTDTVTLLDSRGPPPTPRAKTHGFLFLTRKTFSPPPPPAPSRPRDYCTGRN